MEENKVEITVSEYHDLLRKAERIAVLERMLKRNKYLSTGDVRDILCIEETEGSTDGEL